MITIIIFKMKRVLLPLCIVALFALASCNKEKTCECVTEVDGTQTGTTETVIEDGECSDMNTSSTTLGITSSVTCTEK